jgi:hypothetical protein
LLVLAVGFAVGALTGSEAMGVLSGAGVFVAAWAFIIWWSVRESDRYIEELREQGVLNERGELTTSERTGQLGEDRQVGMEPDPLDPSDAERQ